MPKPVFTSTTWSRVVWPIALALTCYAGSAQAAGKTVALLVGVGDYQTFQSGPGGGDLEGPPYDVAAMRLALSANLGVADVHIRTLVDQQATRANILAELRQLKDRTKAGDHIIVYLSGHGTSRLDVGAGKDFTAALPYSSGAFLTYEFSFERPEAGMIVGRTDLQPVIRELEAGGRSLWVISDSCFSGQQVRSVALASPDKLPGRFIPPRYASEGSRINDNNGARVAPDPYPYRNTVFLGASAEGEVAADISSAQLKKFPTLDGKPHGAFTDALLRILYGRLNADYDASGSIDYAEMHAALSQWSSERGYGQSPQRLPNVSEDNYGLALRKVVRSAAPMERSMSFLAPHVNASVVNPLRVGAAGLPPGLLQVLGTVKGMALVDTDADAIDLRLSQSTKDPGAWVLRSPAGDAISTFVREASARTIAGMFTQFAWAKQVRTLGEQGRRGLLQAEVAPSQFGGNFLVGDKIAFVVQPDRPAHLLLLNINAEGEVSVLYPSSITELAPLPNGRPVAINGTEVQLPLGVDMQMLFAFDQAEPELPRLRGMDKIHAADPRLRDLEQLLVRSKGRYTMATSEIRTLAKPGP